MCVQEESFVYLGYLDLFLPVFFRSSLQKPGGIRTDRFLLSVFTIFKNHKVIDTQLLSVSRDPSLLI
jgi:hypothetical protein